jgi:hypothetical protein
LQIIVALTFCTSGGSQTLNMITMNIIWADINILELMHCSQRQGAVLKTLYFPRNLKMAPKCWFVLVGWKSSTFGWSFDLLHCKLPLKVSPSLSTKLKVNQATRNLICPGKSCPRKHPLYTRSTFCKVGSFDVDHFSKYLFYT